MWNIELDTLSENVNKNVSTGCFVEHRTGYVQGNCRQLVSPGHFVAH